MPKIHMGDEIMVMKGKDKGKKGKVEKVFIDTNKVRVAGINMVKKHQKSQGDKKKGGIIDIPQPLPIARVRLVCSKCNQPARIGYKIENDGRKYRVCKKCKQII